MKLIYSLIIILLFSLSSFAQPYGNEWINYSQQYYKFPVTEEGIYRITYQDLANAQFDLSRNPKNIQLFSHGEEQFIYIKGENDDAFNTNDYIEFYAKPNDGWLDAQIYTSPEDQLTTHYSLYNDTIYCYLTLNTSFNNKRYTIETDNNFSSYSPTQFCYKEVLQQYSTEYRDYTGSTEFTEGEGWVDYYLAINTSNNHPASKNYPIETPNFVTGKNLYLEFTFISVSNARMSGDYNHHIHADFLNLNYDTLFRGLKQFKENHILSSSQLNTTNPFLFRVIDDINAPADKAALSYIKVNYPHNFNIDYTTDFKFTLPNSTSDKSLLEIQGFNYDTDLPVLYDITSGRKINIVENSGILKALVPNGSDDKVCFLTAKDKIKNTSSIEKVIFQDYLSQGLNIDYIIISHERIWDGAQEYKNYRNSTGFNTLLVDVETLYDQFSYGIKKHPLAIRNFINLLIQSYDSIPKNLFLLGKSIHSAQFRKDSANYSNTLVPSFGFNSSDVLLTSELDGNKYEAAIPTGRLSARTNEDVIIYLDKVKGYESYISPQEWKKNIIHFGGGKTVQEQTYLANYLSAYENIIENPLFGGSVSTFLKNNSEPIQISESDSIRELINNGSSMITFFGHGSSSGFDQGTDEPSSYNNKDKYPFLLANSCLAGDIHTVGTNISDKWIIIEDKGAIAFLASVNRGYASYLNGFSTELYKQISQHNYGGSIGSSIKYAKNNYLNGIFNDIYKKNTCLEFTLHGDPAIVINKFNKPDLTVDNSSVYFDPINVTTEIDTFNINIIIKNISRAVTDTFIVELERVFPEGETEDLNFLLAGCNYKDTITIKLPVDVTKGPGLNTFNIKVDPLQQIEEISELNNNISVNLIIRSSEIIPIYPYKYAIYPNNNVTLKASSGNIFANESSYIFQIDTNDTFLNPLAEQVVNNQYGVIEWTVPFTLSDTTVYYWRVSKNDQNNDDNNWRESSFIYIPEKEGWSQAHFFQFKNDDYRFIDYNRAQRKYEYINDPKVLKCYNIGNPPRSEYYDIKYMIDATRIEFSCCGEPASIIVAVLDPVTLEPWESDRADYGHNGYPICVPSQRVMRFFVFNINETDLSSLSSFITNSIPDGHHLLIYSWRNVGIQGWNEEVYEAFEFLGASNIRTIPNDYPFIFYTEKGNLTTSEEVIGDSNRDHIYFERELIVDFNYGYITSELIGPSIQWNTLHWDQHSSEAQPNDEARLQIYGILPNNDEVLLKDSILTDTPDLYDLNSFIDADIYNHLKLKLFTKDEITKTPTQLDKWQVTYEGVPETVLNPGKGYYTNKDTLQEGDNFIFSLATENISQYDMDSLLIKYSIQDKNNNLYTHKVKRLRPHASGDVLIDTVSVSTLELAGLNSLWMEVNPFNASTGTYDQLEQYHFNNIAQKYFYVESDNANPLLDVTFNGIHILDGDIISPKPEIQIKLNDENKYLALNDTSLFAIYLKSQYDDEEKRVYFIDGIGNEQLIWAPASLPDNSFTIEYNPNFITDGIYELRVQAKDVSNNESGSIDYKISFEIINKSSITDVFNYPNPFSTSTRFVFTLTGSEIPTDFRIQIYTVTGKVVRVITVDELGPINIGRNITEYAWDGKDMYGDQLANGVYFYKVITKIEGENIEKRQTGAEKYFKKGIGKMYLMR